MSNKLNVRFENHKRGNKVLTRVFVDDKEVGSRTTARPYTHILLCRRSQAGELDYAKRNLEGQHRQIADYSAVIASGVIPYDFRCLTLDNYKEFIVSCTAHAEKLNTQIAKLSGPALPEFDAWHVYSWHSAAKHAKPPAHALNGYRDWTVIELVRQ